MKGQLPSGETMQEISRPAYKAYAADMKAFYETINRKTGWYFSGSTRDQWTYLLQHAEDWGIGSGVSGKEPNKVPLSKEDTVYQEVKVLRDLLRFYKEFKFGYPPDFGYDGVLYEPDPGNPGKELALAINIQQLDTWVTSQECSSREYLAVKAELQLLLSRIRDTLYRPGIKFGNLKVNAHDPAYRQQLWNYGLMDSLHIVMDSARFQHTLLQWQELFYFPPVKMVERGLLKELKVPVTDRIKELGNAMRYFRWLDGFRKANTEWIVVNIPSATLRYYRQDTVMLHSKVVVGKRSTRTPVLFSKVSDIVMYPYWMVPNKIAVKELLPIIRNNPSYLDANNFQVLDRNGRVVDPASVHWNSLGPGNFPYTLRQSTGCDNSLGIVKMQFYSSYDVYLHDTPYRAFFSFYKRFYSHGCIRVEKAIELAGLLLKDRKDKMDSIIAHADPLNQKPFPIALVKKVPVMVVYQTAWLDDRDQVHFYGDIYEKLRAGLTKLPD